MSLVSFEPVLPLAAAGERLTGVLAAVRRLREIEVTPPAVPALAEPLPKPGGPPDGGRRGSRRPATATSTRWAGSGLDAHAEAGRVAVVGPERGGQEHAAPSALMRTVDVVSGTITVNGVDLRQISRRRRPR